MERKKIIVDTSHSTGRTEKREIKGGSKSLSFQVARSKEVGL